MLGKVFILEGYVWPSAGTVPPLGAPLWSERPCGGLWPRLESERKFWLRSGLSVTSLAHHHKLNWDSQAIVTWLSAKTLSNTGSFRLSRFFFGHGRVVITLRFKASQIFLKRPIGRFFFLPNNLHSKKAPLKRC